MPSRRRADADRNNAAVLAAAAELFYDPDAAPLVSMADVADRAGVGKGTVFRAYGNKAGLLRALMAERAEPVMNAAQAREDLPPAERLLADLDDLLQLKIANRRLSLAMDSLQAGSPFDAVHYGWWHTHFAKLLRETGTAEADFGAHLLLAAARSDLIEHLIGDEGWSARRLCAAARQTATALIGARTTCRPESSPTLRFPS
ncbi:TetR/AcrR family transcriptional regulator [Micromonospora chokoriensis]